MAQPKYHILREYINGVMDQNNKFYPYKHVAFIATGSLIKLSKIRYFVKTITLQSNNTAAAAGAIDKVEATCDGTTYAIAYSNVATTFAASQESVVQTIDCNCLSDVNTPISVTLGSVTPSCLITYAMIDEFQGEFVG